MCIAPGGLLSIELFSVEDESQSLWRADGCVRKALLPKVVRISRKVYVNRQTKTLTNGRFRCVVAFLVYVRNFVPRRSVVAWQSEKTWKRSWSRLCVFYGRLGVCEAGAALMHATRLILCTFHIMYYLPVCIIHAA